MSKNERIYQEFVHMIYIFTFFPLKFFVILQIP